MENKKRVTRLVVMVSLVMAMTTVIRVNGQATCFDAFLTSCEDPSTPAKFSQCCTFLKDQYDNDLTCLCSIFQLAELDPSTGDSLLTTCGVNTGGISPCSDTTSPVPVSQPPHPFDQTPPPKTTSSPPTPATFVQTPPPKTTSSPPTPVTFVQTPPVVGSQSPSTTTAVFDAPPSPSVSVINTPFARNCGAPRSSLLIGMAGLVLLSSTIVF